MVLSSNYRPRSNFPNKKTHPLKGRAGNSRGTTLLFRRSGFRLAPDADEPPLGNPNLGTALRPVTGPAAAPYSSSGGPLQDEFGALLSPDFHLPPALWDRVPLLLPFVADFVKMLNQMLTVHHGLVNLPALQIQPYVL